MGATIKNTGQTAIAVTIKKMNKLICVHMMQWDLPLDLERRLRGVCSWIFKAFTVEDYVGDVV